MVKKYSEVYRANPSLLHREQAELDFYFGFVKRSISHSIKAIITSPLDFSNYRLLQHVLRKSILRI